MVWRLRRAISIAGTRFNLSRSGVGWSWDFLVSAAVATPWDARTSTSNSLEPASTGYATSDEKEHDGRFAPLELVCRADVHALRQMVPKAVHLRVVGRNHEDAGGGPSV
jgi:hypothetical protein